MIGFGNMAEPDFASSPSGNVAEKYPPAGGMGDWGLPQHSVCHTNAMLATAPPMAAGAMWCWGPIIYATEFL